MGFRVKTGIESPGKGKSRLEPQNGRSVHLRGRGMEKEDQKGLGAEEIRANFSTTVLRGPNVENNGCGG